MTDVRADVRGVDQLAATLGDAADALRRADDLADAGAAVVADEARPRTPKRTGALMATVRHAAGVVSAGSVTVTYAGVVHWGAPRRGMRAQPWIAEAYRSAEGRAVEAVTGEVVAIVEGIRAA